MVIGVRALHAEEFTPDRALNDKVAYAQYEGGVFIKPLCLYF